MKDIILDKEGISYSSDEYLKAPEAVRFLLREEKNDLAQFDGDKEKKLHLNVLPHPYFGNVDKPTVLFLAKNPSYADYYEDEVDTYLYLKNHNGDLSHFINDLSDVNFFKNWNEGKNISFISSWKWWNKKIIRKVQPTEAIIDKIGFMNLCGYQSKSFEKEHFEQFRSVSPEKLKQAIDSAQVIIVVWKKILEFDKIIELIGDKPCLALNKDKTGANVNSLYKILNRDCPEYVTKQETDAIKVIKKCFK